MIWCDHCGKELSDREQVIFNETCFDCASKMHDDIGSGDSRAREAYLIASQMAGDIEDRDELIHELERLADGGDHHGQ